RSSPSSFCIYTLCAISSSVLLMTLPPPRSPLFPYTTLFRSQGLAELRLPHGGRAPRGRHPRHPGRAASGWVPQPRRPRRAFLLVDRKSTRLNSSHVKISYAVFCLKKKRSTTAQWHAEREQTT